MPNPYNFGNPVPPELMVGRWDQVEAITHDLINQAGHSHIVIGGRRFGKSSFLGSLQHRLLKFVEQEKERGWYIFPVLVDMRSLLKDSIEGVFGLLIKTLYHYFDPLNCNKILGVHFDLPLEQTKLYSFIQGKRNECALDEFSEILEEFLDLFGNFYGFPRLVFLLDEIEVALDRSWTERFFSQLRSLIYQGFLANHLRYVIAGSSKVIDVREQGSPLLNMLKITYLNALEKEDTLQIINRMKNVRPNMIKAVLEQSGGHPFIAQYLMHQIWELDASKSKMPSVKQPVNKFIHEREADLEQWRADIGISGKVVYKVLAESTRWLTEMQIRQHIIDSEIKVGHGLTTLCYHGLAIHDNTWTKYRLVGEVFKSWFQRDVLPFMDVAMFPNSSFKDTLHSKHNTLSRKAGSRAKDSMVVHEPLRNRAFISYSHKDEKYLHELQSHLASYIQLAMVDVWNDTMILPGSKWEEEIEKALHSTKVAVLLVSANFLASDFIRDIELPSLLAASEQEGVVILTVLVRSCTFANTAIRQFQFVNAPSRPLSNMAPGKRDEVWSKVAELIREALGAI